jgi:hypothetical protein
VKSEPRTKGPGIARKTAGPPPAQVPVLAGDAVAVGKEKAGPTPQMTLQGCAGVRKVCSWMSPTPLELVVGPVGDADDGDDGAGDVGPLWRDVDRDDGLGVEIEEGLIYEGAAGVEVELEGDGYDVAAGILRGFGEIGDVVLGVRRLCCSGLLLGRGCVLARRKAGHEELEQEQGKTHYFLRMRDERALVLGSFKFRCLRRRWLTMSVRAGVGRRSRVRHRMRVTKEMRRV